jgi:CheY-like chemotaxis protein
VSSPDQQANLSGNVSPLLVLIAEDEEPIALALADLIEEIGYQTLIAQNGRRALELAWEYHPALIITDLMMPYLTEREVIAALRAQEDRSGQYAPPIILMSAAGRAHTYNTGADAVLLKPFDLDEVEGLLYRFLPPPASLR